jgi:hypothetical protein
MIKVPESSIQAETTDACNGIYCLCWYSPKDEKIVGFEDMPKLTSKKVRKWFSLSDDDPGIYPYVVTASERQHLAKIVKTNIDLNQYDYFVECHKA